MFSQNLSFHLCYVVVVLGRLASSSTASYGELEEDCKYLFVPYTTKCIFPNETVRDLSNRRGPAAVCATSLSHRVVDSWNGTVEFTILLPHNAVNEWIYLYALKPMFPNDQLSLCSHVLHGKHSYFQLLEDNENQTVCSPEQLMEVTWKANYLYSGCYIVKADLPSPEPEKNCTSNSFHLQTDFKMEPVAYQNLSVTRKTINDKLTIILEKDLVLNNDCSNPMISSSCVRLKLSLEEQNLPIFVATVFPNCPVVPLSSNSLECSCDWTRPQLECSFPNLPVGNYCVQVEALDTRCVRDTVWVNSSLIKMMNDRDPCVWEICNLEMKNQTARFGPNLATEHSARTPISWLVVVFAMAAIGAICISLYMRAKKRVFRSPSTPNIPVDESPCEKLIESPEVLLLYARDCPLFMDAMMEFRNLLQRTTGARIYDVWDNRQREEMDASGETWIVNRLFAENIQVIVMVTPISRLLEDDLLKGNNRSYLIPDGRDDIFLSALHASIRLTVTHENRSRKFIVARMNSVKCSENILTSFKPLCTIYTLPAHLDRLLLHVLNAQPVHNSLGGQRFEGPFRRKAEEYEKYVSMNPSYLNSIINVD